MYNKREKKNKPTTKVKLVVTLYCDKFGHIGHVIICMYIIGSSLEYHGKMVSSAEKGTHRTKTSPVHTPTSHHIINWMPI